MKPENRQGPTDVLLDVEHLDQDGFGVSAYQNRVVRVKAALPGEAVTARILRKRKGELLAEAKEVSSSHEDRRRAPCNHYPRCGGCVLQHLDYSAQLRFKQQQLLDALNNQSIAPLQVCEPVSGPRLRYRRKARLGVKQLSNELLVGFRESFSARVGRLQACETLADPFGQELVHYAGLISQLSCADKVPQLEVAAGDSERQVIIRHLAPMSTQDMIHLGDFEQQHALRLLLQPGGPSTVHTLTTAPVPLLEYGLPQYGLSLQFAAAQFTQVNPWINARLAGDIGALVRQLGARGAVDLFCGIGNFSLPLARLGLPVHGVELGEDAVAQATANAQRNALSDRCEFVAADLYDPSAASLKVPAAELLLLDPPRSGAGPNLSHWLGPEVRSVIYVSCNPTTFASDAQVLKDAGFALERVGIYDMFPQTSHVETLGLFRR